MPIRDETMPILVAVFCDECGDEHTADYLVPAGQDSLAVARAWMQEHAGWQTGETGDWCPKCARYGRKGDAEPESESTTMHVYPIKDLVEHETTGDGCVCIPRTEPVEREDGSMGWLLVHHSLDGREAWERFAESRKVQWCRCRVDSHPHIWEPPGTEHASDHWRAAPSLHWQLDQFQRDARAAGIIR